MRGVPGWGKTLLAAVAAWGIAGAPAWAENVLLRGATVHTAAGETLPGGDVWILDGMIVGVGPRLDAPGAAVVSLDGLHLYPGLVSAGTSLGLTEIDAVRPTRDGVEVGSFTPDVESWIAVNPDSELIPVARANGIAYALVVPQGGAVSGQSGFLRLVGWTWEEMLVRPAVAVHVFWPSMDIDVRAQESGRRAREGKAPEEQDVERRRKVKEVTDFFEEARAYWAARLAWEASDGTRGISRGKTNPAWEAMRGAVLGESLVVVHADEVRQIRSAVEWASAQGYRIAIAGGRDAWRVAGLLAEKKVPVIFESVFDLPARDTDAYDVHFRAAGILRQAGVKVALGAGLGSWAAAGLRNLPYMAAQARAFGLADEDALAAITRIPAEILGVDEILGSIAPGRTATLLAADGDLLDLRSHVVRMWIDGRETDLESRHTRLYRRYRDRPLPK